MQSAIRERLGAMTPLDDSDLETANIFLRLNGKHTVNYQAAVTYEKSTATLQLQVIRVDGAWKLRTFRVTSPALIP